MLLRWLFVIDAAAIRSDRYGAFGNPVLVDSVDRAPLLGVRTPGAYAAPGRGCASGAGRTFRSRGTLTAAARGKRRLKSRWAGSSSSDLMDRQHLATSSVPWSTKLRGLYICSAEITFSNLWIGIAPAGWSLVRKALTLGGWSGVAGSVEERLSF